ncbi:MAG TPA: ubiquinol-cytochrome c reductase iron-sulfur subunit [Hyphomicrobiaceae bacterium]|nr:ubiquinol-cytochrome c reductase iron-sulfur subunit [Hyphomicrobiaceae bacterium]
MASHSEEPSRRDFLTIAAGSWAAVGAAATLWPLVQQMNPDASTQALASIEVDVAQIKEGQAIVVMWRGKPVFIRNRTKAEIEKAQAVAIGELSDKSARVEGRPAGLPAVDQNRVKKGKENWLVLVGICTHLGCIPKGTEDKDRSFRGDYGGWFCVCHGSHYDESGRIRKGPAPRNLDVPPYEFVADTKIKIG